MRIEEAQPDWARERAWSTAEVPESERFALWQDVVSEAFVSVSVTSPAPGPFMSTVAAHSVGALGVSRIASQAQVVSRTSSQIQQSAGGVFFLNLPLTDDTRARQDGRTAHMAGGDFVIVDSARPFELGFERAFDQISLTLPHDLLAPFLPSVADVTGVRVPGDRGIGAVASAAIRALADRAGALDRDAARTLARQVAGLVALSLGAAPAPRVTSSPALLFQTALDEVERSLGNPELTPGRVAERVGVSTRYLHQLFSERGLTVARWILARRLERCREDLLDPVLADRTIGDVAFHNGFRDPSYFARAFKARYEQTPRELRRHGLRI